MSRLLFSRRAERQLQRLPGEVRVHLETHLENLALMLGSTVPVAQVLSRLEREEDGFVTQVEGIRICFALDAVLRVLLVHSVMPANEKSVPGGFRFQGVLPAT